MSVQTNPTSVRKSDSFKEDGMESWYKKLARKPRSWVNPACTNSIQYEGSCIKVNEESNRSDDQQTLGDSTLTKNKFPDPQRSCKEHNDSIGAGEPNNMVNSSLTEDTEAECLLNLEEKRKLRRERLKQKKELKKKEKAVLREEELRKKRLPPKDQKVTLIDHTMLDKLLLRNVPLQKTEKQENKYNDSDFPSLAMTTNKSASYKHVRKTGNKMRKSFVSNEPVNNNVVSISSELTEHTVGSKESQNKNSELSDVGLAKINVKHESSEQQESTADDRLLNETKKNTSVTEEKSCSKRPKRRDPIHLSINDILKTKETKPELSGKTEKKLSRRHMTKTEIVRYCGNILDSDNPERKRGKKKEVPKAKRPSALKQIILQDRIRRKKIYQQRALSRNVICNPLDDKSRSISSSDDKVTTIKNEWQNILPSSSECKTVSRDESIAPAKEDEECISLPSLSKDYSVNAKDCDVENIKKTKNVSVNTKNQRENETSKIEYNNDTIVNVPVKKIHSRKFREYCDHFITPDILSATTALLEDIVKFHDRQYLRSPVKASAKRRHVTGLKEVRKYMVLHRVRLLVIAPDLEQVTTSGGLDDVVNQLKESAIADDVPYVFALGRRHLGYVLKKKVPVSCVAVLNYDGTENNFKQLMIAVQKAREEYKLQVLGPPAHSQDPVQVESTTNRETDVNKEVVASLLAKLTISDDAERSKPFLQTIEKHSKHFSENSDDNSDDD